MELKLVNTFTESRLFPAITSFKKYTSKDTTDLVFLYFISLEILKNDFEYIHVVTAYAKKTAWYNGFENIHPGATDLYLLLHQITKKDEHTFKPHKNNDVFLKTIQTDEDEILAYLRRIARNQSIMSVDRKFMISLEEDLEITDSCYRSMRRLCYMWKDLTEHQKKLLITRLLMALRHRARLCDLLPYIEHLANKDKLELQNVYNPETKEKPKETSHDTTSHDPKPLSGGQRLAANAIGGTLGAIGGIMLGSAIHNHFHHKKDD